MKGVASAEEGALASQSRCYFSLPTRSAHDVVDYLRCGPILLPWSSPSQPWLTYKLSGRLTSSGEELSVALTPAPSATVGLVRGEVLRRPDGANPPAADAGIAVPAVPRQLPGWGGVLAEPPPNLPPAPVSDLVGDWGQSYRLVAYGEVGRLSARLDQAALKVAIDPPGSAWATVVHRGGSGSDSRPLARLLLPPKGQVFAVAELAVSAGEAGGAVPAQANGSGPGSTDEPTLAVLGGTTDASFPTSVPPDPSGAGPSAGAPSAGGPSAAGPSAGSLAVVASVPIGSKPVLDITDKGLTQQVSLANGQLGAGPSILTRAGTNDALSASGNVAGADIRVSDASLVWFAGSDGGTVPPNPNEAYLQILASASPLGASFLPAADFTLQLPGGQVVPAQALPDADREAIVVGFLVPASFSDGTVVVAAAGRSFDVPVRFA
jgi:hypothetical protein